MMNFDEEMTAYGLDPDKSYPEDHPLYAKRLALSKKWDDEYPLPPDILGSLILNDLFEELFKRSASLTDYQLKDLYRLMTTESGTLLFVYSLTGITPESISKLVKDRLAGTAIMARINAATVKAPDKIQSEIATYNVLCSELKTEALAYLQSSGSLFPEEIVFILLSKKREYDEYFKSIGKRHYSDPLNIKYKGKSVPIESIPEFNYG